MLWIASAIPITLKINPNCFFLRKNNANPIKNTVVVVDMKEAFDINRAKKPCSYEKAHNRDAMSAIEYLLNSIFAAQKTRKIVATLIKIKRNTAPLGLKFEK